MRVVKVIQPHEFGDNFILEDGKWKVKFPPIATSGVEVSKDANNLITLGGDGGMFADATRLHAYALVQDNENMKIHLYRHQADLEFDVANATLINSIDMLELNGQFDDITITDAVVTFKDVQTDTELVFDTDQFQKVEALQISGHLGGYHDDKLKVGATDRLEFTILDSVIRYESDWTELDIYDPPIVTLMTNSRGSDFINELNLNIADKYKDSFKFEEISVVEEEGLLKTTFALINLGDTLTPFTAHVGYKRTEDIPFPYVRELQGNPAYSWNYLEPVQGGNLVGYFAPSGTTVEDNGIDPKAFILDVRLGGSDSNILRKAPDGLLLLPPAMFDIEHSLEARSYQVDVPDDEIEIDEFVRTINGNEIRIPAVTLKNSRGKTLAAIVAEIPDKLHTYEPS